MLQVNRVVPGSPAAGVVEAGMVFHKVGGRELPAEVWDHPRFLGRAITDAEAGDGVIALATRDAGGQEREIRIRIPVLGAYSETWPVDCRKTRGIIDSGHLAQIFH